MKTNENSKNKSQLERFKEAARQVETDDDEQRFDQMLKKVVKPADKSVTPARKN